MIFKQREGNLQLVVGKIERDMIICPALQVAYERAMRKAFDSKGSAFGIDYPRDYANHVSSKGLLEGSDACQLCGKKIEVDLHLAKIEGATDSETGKPVKLYDSSDLTTFVKVSGKSCLDEDIHQK